MKTYHYTIEGTARGHQTWTTTGTVECEFHEAFEQANRASFAALTQGKAVFGNPGQGGCRGPYEITRVVIKLVNGDA